MNVLSATAASDWCGGMEAGRKARSLMLGTGGEAAARIVDRHLAAGDHQRPARTATLRSARRSHTVTHKQRLWLTRYLYRRRLRHDHGLLVLLELRGVHLFPRAVPQLLELLGRNGGSLHVRSKEVHGVGIEVGLEVAARDRDVEDGRTGKWNHDEEVRRVKAVGHVVAAELDGRLDLFQGLVRISDHVVSKDPETVLLAGQDQGPDIALLDVQLVAGILADDPQVARLERKCQLREPGFDQRLQHLAVRLPALEEMYDVDAVDVDDVEAVALNLAQQAQGTLLVRQQRVVLDEYLLDAQVPQIVQLLQHSFV